MTLNELIKHCQDNGVSFDTQIAIRSKDDYLLTESKIYMDNPYFGNCGDGSNWQEETYPVDEETGERQYHEVLILDTE